VLKWCRCISVGDDVNKSNQKGYGMKIIFFALVLILGVAQADDCGKNKSEAEKYEKLGLEEGERGTIGGLEMAANYLETAIGYKKETLNSCFFGFGEKEKIHEVIEDLEKTRRDMIRVAARLRQHEMNVAKESAREMAREYKNRY